MRKFLLFIIPLILSTTLLTGCGSDEEIVKEPEKATGSDDEKKREGGGLENGDGKKQDSIPDNNTSRSMNLTDAQITAVSKNNDFAFNFYRQLIQEPNLKGKNVFVSPLSVTYLLGMLNNGAKGKTTEEITKVLGFDGESAQNINELCKKLIDNAPFVDDLVTLKLADCVVTNVGIDLVEQYQKEINDYYQAEVFSKDFSQMATIDFINNWCSRHTEGMIQKIIDELNPQSQTVLMNAIYFKAPWSGKFIKEDTRNELFIKENGKGQIIEMMHRLDGTEYTVNSTYATIGLPYGAGKNYKMYVLLPNQGKTVDDILGNMTNYNWNENLQQLYGSLVDVKLPKFSIESEMHLNDVLIALGAPSIFSDESDFTTMTKQNRQLIINLIKQKSAIEVSEGGTEAAAVTIEDLVTDNGNGDSLPTPQFHADHPFVYLIQEASSGAIFFIGTYHGN